jgi:Flp pilus assembly protein TadD
VDEFVVCPSCGTRIKAGREFCLRCFEPLPTPDRPARQPIWESLGLSDTKKVVLIGVSAAVVLSLVAVIVYTKPPTVDETPRPAVTPTARPPSPTPAPGETPVAAPAGGDATAGGSAFEPTAGSPPAALSAADVAALEAKRSSYEAELVKRPNDADLVNDLGQALEQLGRPSDAVSRFERAIALDRGRAKFHVNLAHAATGAGLWDRAVGEYREAARLRPDDFTIQYALALTLRRKGDDAGAIPEFQKAVAISPNDASVHLSLGISLETVGRIAEAVLEYRKYLTIQPSSPDAQRLKEHIESVTASQP